MTKLNGLLLRVAVYWFLASTGTTTVGIAVWQLVLSHLRIVWVP